MGVVVVASGSSPSAYIRGLIRRIDRGDPNGIFVNFSPTGGQLPVTDWTEPEFLHKSNTHAFPDKFHGRSQNMLRIFLITKDQT